MSILNTIVNDIVTSTNINAETHPQTVNTITEIMESPNFSADVVSLLNAIPEVIFAAKEIYREWAGRTAQLGQTIFYREGFVEVFKAHMGEENFNKAKMALRCWRMHALAQRVMHDELACEVRALTNAQRWF